MYDIIADIHGHADKLEALLQKLAYQKINGIYKHPNRKVLFVGDYIDRGPKILETLAIVKSMVDAGNAIALMGNHEYNAICFHYLNAQGGHLREHSIKNMMQHYETIKQFHNQQSLYESYIEWFLSLPLYFETEQFRAVHACWDNENISLLKTKLIEARLSKDLLYESTIKNTSFHTAIEETLKGKEMKMPNGLTFTDKDGALRNEIRMKWWENPLNNTYKILSVLTIDNLPDAIVDSSILKNKNYYNEAEKPIFFGHYWLQGSPQLYRSNVCCLDYSVAKGGSLVAYRNNEELLLSSNNLIWV
jgi:hypothetical protein